MTNQSKPTPEETAIWQKRLASQANNRAWTLADQSSRTPEEDEQLLQAAHNEPWEIAFTLLVNANVAHVSGKAAQHKQLYEQAQACIENLVDPEDQKILQVSFASVPKPQD